MAKTEHPFDADPAKVQDDDAQDDTFSEDFADDPVVGEGRDEPPVSDTAAAPAAGDPPSDPHGGAVVASICYVDGKRGQDVSIDNLHDVVSRQHGLIWLGLKDPDPELLKRVSAELNIGCKAEEELLAPHRRPKIIDFGNAVLVVAITVEVGNERPIFGETQILIGKGYLLTVRRGAVSTHRELRERLENAPELLARGSDFVAAELLDLLVDRYVAAATKLEHVVENAEQKLLIRGQKDSDVRRVYRQRRDLLRIHAAISPLAEICRRLSRVEVSNIDVHARPYFGEVADRVVRVDELINSFREALAFAFEASLMIGQSAQNDTTRKLAAWAAILAVPTAIAGIYGMNFEHMPELKAVYGYPVTLGVIVSACSFLYWRFRKTGWL
ncbi:magnesium and cobalt transport protein CorA [Alcaligenaceae bacterium C4P045]|nr:magnesium and cobalt transport protein CorA [Alcaligenaceae bacterium C4P045]